MKSFVNFVANLMLLEVYGYMDIYFSQMCGIETCLIFPSSLKYRTEGDGKRKRSETAAEGIWG